MKNRKGFTLTELLVVVVILGIITGISIPLIRNLSATFEKKKYENYRDGVASSGKLYNNSYSEDLFGHNEYGCAYIPYEKLANKNLIKDIDISGVSCNSPKTYVRVVKQKDKYGYATFVGCGKEVNGSASNINVSMPEVIPDMTDEACTIGSNIVISADASQIGNTYDKQRKTTKVTITSYTGISNNISISTKWSQNQNDYNNTGFTKTTFKVTNEQEKTLLNGNPVKSTSKELITPEGAEGQWYLIVRVDHLQDLYGNRWKNPDNTDSKYLTFGPFSVDNTAPTIIANVYKCANNSTVKTGKSLNTKTVNGGTGDFVLTGLPGNVNGWLNKANYPNGVCFEFTLKDNNSIKSATWQWNNLQHPDSAAAATYKVLTGGPTVQNYTGGTTQTYTNFLNGDGHRYAVLTVKDFVGNKAVLNVDVKIDRTGPTCGTASGASTTWTSGNRTVTQACSDLNGCVKNTYPVTYSSSTKTANITIKDKVGNSTNCPVNVYVDKTKPNCGSASGASTSWTSGNRTIKVGCTDSHSGCSKEKFEDTFKSTAKTDSITIKDKVGHTNSCSVNVYIDKGDPSASISKSSSSSCESSQRTLKIKCSDSYSGIKAYYWGTSKPSSAGSITSTSNLSNVTGSGLTKKVTSSGTYYLGCKDKVGNYTTKSIKITKESNTETKYGNWVYTGDQDDSHQTKCILSGEKWKTDTIEYTYLNYGTGNLPSVCAAHATCSGSHCKKGCCLKRTVSKKTTYCYKAS